MKTVSDRNKFTFGIGTIGRDMVYSLMSMYLIFYLTDVLDVSTGVMWWLAGILVFFRIYDALNDPLMGFIVDNTHTRWGKFKPWIAVGVLVTAVFTVLIFTDFGFEGRSYIIMFTVFYFFWEIGYTANDIAYWSMLPALSIDQKEREKIGAIARICANVGLFFVVAGIIPLTKLLGEQFGSLQKGWFAFTVLICTIMAAGQCVTLFGVKESKFIVNKNESTSLKELFNIIVKNDQLFITAVAMSLFMIGYVTTTGFGIYFFKYAYGNENMYPVFALILGVTQITALAVFPLFSKRYERKTLYTFAIILMTAGYIIFFFAPVSTMLFIGTAGIFMFIGQSFIQLLMLMFLADTVDYGHWKLGKRNDSITFSLQPLINKLGGAVAGGVVAAVVIVSGIKDADSAADVTGRGLLMMKMAMLVFPALCIVLSYFLYRKKYIIDNKFYNRILSDLRARGELTDGVPDNYAERKNTVFSGPVKAKNIPVLIKKAHEAQIRWAQMGYRKRAEYIRKAGRVLAGKQDEIVNLIHNENGKLAIDALAAEIIPALMAVPWYIKKGRRLCKSHAIRGGNPLMVYKRSRMIYRPWGVVGIISPWNYPFSIPFSEVIMALLAGNAVILKTASLTPCAGRIITEILEAADLPENIFMNVELPGEEAGPAFINGGIDKLFFTGSTAVGKELMALASQRLLPLTLELGGADAAIICNDADIDRAVSGIIWAGFSNAGQSCAGIQRVLVHKNIYSEFMEKLKNQVEALRPGNDTSCDLGPMISPQQLKTVQKQIASCLKKGAQIAAQSPVLKSGKKDKLIIPAVVLSGIKKGMPIMDSEVFGPVVGVLPFDNEQEALDIANASSYGLTASVWSRSRNRAKKLAARINAGAVMINDHLMSHGLAETPWGGFGDSGLGRTHGEAGFREMLKASVIVDDVLPGGKREPWWQPYSQNMYNGLSALGNFLGGPGLGKRLQSLSASVKFFMISWKKNGDTDK